MIEVDLEEEQDSCTIEQRSRQTHRSREEQKLQRQPKEDTLDNLSKLFDKNILAELTSEDTWMNRLRRIIEQGDKQGFELMGPYTNPLWSQIVVQDECILVDNRLAVPVQLRQAFLKRLLQGHPGQEAILWVSRYLWWPHVHYDNVNLAKECRSCTRYGKNAKYRYQCLRSRVKKYN